MNPVIDLTGTGRNDVSWRVEPVNLLGALWVLAADEFVGGKRVNSAIHKSQNYIKAEPHSLKNTTSEIVFLTLGVRSLIAKVSLAVSFESG